MTERNSSANPHTYVVGTTCNARLGEQTMEEENNNIIIYPNPASDLIVVSGNLSVQSDVSISIISSLGVEIFKTSSTGFFEESFDLSSAGSGMYVVRISSGEKVWIKN